jgi:hypothetical protein
LHSQTGWLWHRIPRRRLLVPYRRCQAAHCKPSSSKRESEQPRPFVEEDVLRSPAAPERQSGVSRSNAGYQSDPPGLDNRRRGRQPQNGTRREGRAPYEERDCRHVARRLRSLTGLHALFVAWVVAAGAMSARVGVLGYRDQAKHRSKADAGGANPARRERPHALRLQSRGVLRGRALRLRGGASAARLASAVAKARRFEPMQ